MTMPIALNDWPRMLALVEQALDLPSNEHEAWLRALHLSPMLDATLRGLLDERRRMENDNFLGALPLFGDDNGNGSFAHERGPAPGTLLGPWRLLREAGHGGMSTVWLAERADGQLQRQVALKLPHAGPGQELLARRLMRERKILAALEHPNIGRLYDVGITEAGTPYLVMEWVQGVNLLAHADTKRMRIEQRVTLFVQVLNAVQHAHGKLVLHRDLKPANILVTDAGEVKLLDFGIAKPLRGGHEGFDPTELTRAGGRVMTLRYASPEQLLGQPLDAGSDVYSLGVLLYELLCGLPPHALGHAGDGSLERAILQDNATAPSKRALSPELAATRATTAAALRRQLAGELDAIVLRAMALRREDRYGSAEALATDLARWQAGEPVLARLPGPLARMWKFCRRNPWGTGLGSAAVTALGLAAAVATFNAQQARSEALRARAASDFVLGLFEDTDPDRHGGRGYTPAELLTRGRERLLADRQTPAALQDELLAGIGKAQSEMGEFDAAEISLQMWVNLCREKCSAQRLGWALLLRAENDLKRQNFQAAADGLSELGSLLQNGQAPAAFAAKRAELQGWLHHYEARLDAAAVAFKQGLLALQDPRGEHAGQAFELYLATAQNEAERGDVDQTQAALDAAAMAGAQVFRNRPLLAHDLSMTRIVVWDSLGRYQRVAEDGPAALSACRRDMGAASQICSKLQTRLTYAHWRRGDAQKALAMWPVLQEATGASQPEHARLAVLRDAQRVAWLAGSEEQRGHVRVRLAEMERSAQAPMVRARASLYLGEAALLEGRLDAALLLLLAARSHAGPDSRENAFAAQVALLLGLRWLALGQPDQALPLLMQANDAFAALYGSNNPLTLWLGLNRAPALAAAGRQVEAVQLVRSALPAIETSLGAGAPALTRVRELLRRLESAQPAPRQESQGFL